MEANIDAHGILKLLARKHTEDLFVPECKTDSTYVGAPLRLDAWAMRKSWTRPCCTGYEIKCARSDFLRDEKWRGYLDYCHRFYFVSPRKVIEPAELPDEAGLLWVSSTGTKLFTKKLAPDRRQDIPDTIYRYVLMWRTEIGSQYSYASKADQWRAWLKSKKQLQELGYLASQRIRDLIFEEVTKVQDANRKLQAENGALVEVREFCKRLGLDPAHLAWNPGSQVETALADMNGAGLMSTVNHLVEQLTKFRDRLDKQLAPPAE